jgi:hypothetical protein
MAEMEMVERVARRIANDMHAGGDFGMTGEDAYRRRSAEFLALGRAAIEAMRSPNPAMLAAAWRKISADKKAAGVAKLGPGPGCIEWWNAAIDAALSDTSSKG